VGGKKKAKLPVDGKLEEKIEGKRKRTKKLWGTGEIGGTGVGKEGQRLNLKGSRPKKRREAKHGGKTKRGTKKRGN